MKKLAITGGIACGKSTLLEVIKNLGLEVVSVDHLVHEIIASDECQEWLRANAFPEITSQIPRRWLRKLYLLDPEFKDKYDAWIGPRIKEAVLKHPAQIVEFPLLFEMRMEKEFENIWAVVVSDELQLERVVARVGDEDTAKRIIALQLPQQHKLQNSTLFFYGDKPYDPTVIKDTLLTIGLSPGGEAG